MICRWREPRSSVSASPPPTLSSSPVFDASDWPARSFVRMMRTTIARHTAMMLALTSSIVVVPSFSTSPAVMAAPVAPPRLAPPPIRPNNRLAWRGS